MTKETRTTVMIMTDKLDSIRLKSRKAKDAEKLDGGEDDVVGGMVMI
jgi:hypothetical protein